MNDAGHRYKEVTSKHRENKNLSSVVQLHIPEQVRWGTYQP